MGKNYFCDYCKKRMKSNVEIIKKHNDGITHKTARNEHYAKFKDASEILLDEFKKSKCMKYFNENRCNFGAYCRFSHYTPGELNALQQKVNEDKLKKWQETQCQTFDPEIVENILKHQEENVTKRIDLLKKYWNYSDIQLNAINLPPSLHLIDIKLIPARRE